MRGIIGAAQKQYQSLALVVRVGDFVSKALLRNRGFPSFGKSCSLIIVGWGRALWWLDQASQDYELAEQREEVEKLKREFEESIDEIADLRQDLEDTIDERRVFNRLPFPTLASIDQEIIYELNALDLSDLDDAFLIEAAMFVGDMESDEYTDHKNAWRNRVLSLATRYFGDEVEFSVQWTTAGEMIVSQRDYRPSDQWDHQAPAPSTNWDVIVSGDPNNAIGISMPSNIRDQLTEELTSGAHSKDYNAFIYEEATFTGVNSHPQFESHRRLWVCRIADCVNDALPAGFRVTLTWDAAGNLIVRVDNPPCWDL